MAGDTAADRVWDSRAAAFFRFLELAHAFAAGELAACVATAALVWMSGIVFPAVRQRPTPDSIPE